MGWYVHTALNMVLSGGVSCHISVSWPVCLEVCCVCSASNALKQFATAFVTGLTVFSSCVDYIQNLKLKSTIIYV